MKMENEEEKYKDLRRFEELIANIIPILDEIEIIKNNMDEKTFEKLTKDLKDNNI